MINMRVVSLVPERSSRCSRPYFVRRRSRIVLALVESMSSALLRTYVRTRPVQIGGLSPLRSARSRHHLARNRKRNLRLPVLGFAARASTHCACTHENIGRFQRSSRSRTTNEQLPVRHGMSALAYRQVLP